MEEIKTKEEIIKGIKTANITITKRLIENEKYIFGDPENGLIFRVDFANQPIQNDRMISYRIKKLKDAIEILSDINTTEKEIDSNLHTIYQNAKIDDRYPIYLICHFRRKDSL